MLSPQVEGAASSPPLPYLGGRRSRLVLLPCFLQSVLQCVCAGPERRRAPIKRLDPYFGRSLNNFRTLASQPSEKIHAALARHVTRVEAFLVSGYAL